MNNVSGKSVKHIDGIYRRSKSAAYPIQVELPLEEALQIKVNWSSSKVQPKKQQTHDKFYMVATAAFSGSELNKKFKSPRLRRLKNGNEITIGEAIKQAELQVEQTKNFAFKARSISIYKNILSKTKKSVQTVVLFIKKTGVSVLKTIQTAHKNIVVSVKAVASLVIRHKKRSLEIILILGLGIGLVGTLYSYQQYKNNVNKTLQAQQARSDEQWQKLQANWQCISNKWNTMQTNPTISKQQGEITC